jgi:hypothetical protein
MGLDFAATSAPQRRNCRPQGQDKFQVIKQADGAELAVRDEAGAHDPIGAGK